MCMNTCGWEVHRYEILWYVCLPLIGPDGKHLSLAAAKLDSVTFSGNSKMDLARSNPPEMCLKFASNLALNCASGFILNR